MKLIKYCVNGKTHIDRLVRADTPQFATTPHILVERNIWLQYAWRTSMWFALSEVQVEWIQEFCGDRTADWTFHPCENEEREA